jgi:hypothetical protein
MERFAKYTFFVILNFIVLAGCSVKNESFVIPVNYTSDAVMKVYTENTENTYNIKIKCKDGDYSFLINEGPSKWGVDYVDGSCVLNNDKFKENNVKIDNFKMVNPLVYEYDLSKFNNSSDTISQEVVYWDGTYKHVLNFNKENLLPDEIFIYKNDNLVKTIQYSNINIDKEQ